MGLGWFQKNDTIYKKYTAIIRDYDRVYSIHNSVRNLESKTRADNLINEITALQEKGYIEYHLSQRSIRKGQAEYWRLHRCNPCYLAKRKTFAIKGIISSAESKLGSAKRINNEYSNPYIKTEIERLEQLAKLNNV